MRRSQPLLLLYLLLAGVSASGQSYPYPGKGTPVPCNNCGGANENLPTFPYADPLVAHEGRYVDSTTTGNVQNMGMRTIRARVTRLSRARNRIYVALGETIGAYTLDQFFTTTVRQPLVAANKIPVKTSTVWSRYGAPFEKVSRPESIFYAEADNSGWETYLQDGQRVLTDFDADERGYVYIGTLNFGWGIAFDNGATDARHMQFVWQDPVPPLASSVVIALTSGNAHYAVISSNSRGDEKAQLYDVSKPATPKAQAIRSGSQHGIVTWTKYDDGERLALINTDGHLRIYDYATYIANGAALSDTAPPAGRKFSEAAFDEHGNVWVALSGGGTITTNVLMKLAPNANGYAATSFDVYGVPFNASHISADAGRIAVIGSTSASRELRLFEVVDGAPQALDIDDFFRNYYEVVPAGYADPGALTGGSHVRVTEQGSQTFLMYSAEGLGDVYRLQRGAANKIATSIALSSSTNNNTANLTAIVTPQALGIALPSGVVTFTRDGVALATVPLEAFGAAFRATFRSDLASVATASYEGDDVYAPSGPASVTQPGLLPAPTGVNAVAISANSVFVTWQPVSGATAYRLYRSSSLNAPFTFVAQGSGTSHTDTSVSADAAYLYRVAAFDGADGANSASDVATTVMFEDDPLAAGMPIRLVHLTQLRTAVNALRAAAGLSAAAFTDGIPSVVKAVHITELRTFCDEARAALGLGAVAVSPITAQVTNVRKDDVVNLRMGVE